MKEITFYCSDCAKPLCEIVVAVQDKTLPWKLRATCPYGCKRVDGLPQSSYVQTVEGAYKMRGIVRTNPSNPDDYTAVTDVVDVRSEADGSYTFVIQESKTQ